MVAMLSALGTPAADISSRLGLPQNRVECYMTEPATADLIIRLQGSLYPDPAVRVKRVANMALDKIVKTMLTDGKQGFAAAESLLDRAMGKAIQVTENRNLNVNMNDPKAVDSAIAAQTERIARLEASQSKLRQATKVVRAIAPPEAAQDPVAQNLAFRHAQGAATLSATNKVPASFDIVFPPAKKFDPATLFKGL